MQLIESMHARREHREMVSIGTGNLYKGLNTEGFHHYFKNGGITPHPERTDEWITEHLDRAISFARAEPVYVDETCLAVIDKQTVLVRGNLQAARAGDAVIFNTAKHDYSGEETVGWGEVKGLFTTLQSLDRIKSIHEEVLPEHLAWGDLLAKVTLVQAGSEHDLRTKLYAFLQIEKLSSKPLKDTRKVSNYFFGGWGQLAETVQSGSRN